MIASGGRPHMSLKHIRATGPQYGDDEPNTPSKSKGMPRRPLSFYAACLLCMIVLGYMFVGRDAGQARTETYYRRVLVTKMYSNTPGSAVVSDFETPGEMGPTRQRSAVENSEARQREALEIADRILHTTRVASTARPHQGELGELVAGGGSVAANLAEPLTTAPPEGQASDKPEDALAARKASAVTVTQRFSSGEVKEIVVDAARVTFLNVMSDGLESQDLEPSGPEQHAWWSDVITARGERAAPTLREFTRPTAAMATAQALVEGVEGGELAPDEGQCKIAVLDVSADMAHNIGTRQCELHYKRVWPFSRHRYGIDGVETLQPEDYQYSQEYWITQAIRNSSRFVASIDAADFVFVDLWCYHVAWLAYIHPLGNRNTSNPEPYVRRSLNALVKLDRFRNSKGGDFGLVHPNPVMRDLFSEEAMCEDLASVYNMVPERSSLCIWTPDSPAEGKSAIVPYVSSLDLDLENDLNDVQREIFLFYRGGCGHPDPSIRSLFAAGKMLRYELVAALDALGDEDVDAECSCDICDNHMPHPEVQEAYRNARFCPVLPSNVQSSRRLSEVVLAGCVPVFLGPPFHTLPLAQHIDWAGMGVFINISNPSWINDSSPDYLHNHMVGRVWRLDDPKVEKEMVTVDSLEEAVAYLRAMPEAAVAAKRRRALEERWKLYYGPVPPAFGGDGKTSALVEILMQQMCRRAAGSKRRLAAAEAQGVDISESDVQIKQASVVQRPLQGSGWSLFGGGGNTQ